MGASQSHGNDQKTETPRAAGDADPAPTVPQYSITETHTGALVMPTVQAAVGFQMVCRVTNGQEQPLFCNPELRVSASCLKAVAPALPNPRGEQEDAMAICVKNGQLFLLAVDGMGGLGNLGKPAAHEVLSAAIRRMYDGRDITTFARSAERAMAARFSREPSFGAAYVLATVALESGALNLQHQGDVQGIVVPKHGTKSFITPEHTVAQFMLNSGMSPKEIGSKWYNALSNYVGFQEGKAVGANPELSNHILYNGDRLILASDGLFDVIPAREVAELSRTFADRDEFVAMLRSAVAERIRAGNGAQKNDNFTLIVYDHVGVERPKTSPSESNSPMKERRGLWGILKGLAGY